MRQPHALILALAACAAPAPPAPLPPPAVYRVQVEGGREVFVGPAPAPAWDEAGRRVEGGGRSVRARDRWPRLGRLLEACLGPPLATPPAGDPGGFRKLVWADPEPYWRIDLSGMNRCSLEGWLELSVRQDLVRGHDLRSGGLSLHEPAGEAHVQGILDAALRAEALAAWPAADLAGRVLLLKRLSELPEGLEVLEQLIALDDENRPEAEAARDRWRARFGVPDDL